MFKAFLSDRKVRLYGVEAAGEGLSSERHSASLSAGQPGVLHGSRSYLLQDDNGQVSPAHSISAGLDYPGVGPEHSWLKDAGRVTYLTATDEDAIEAFQTLSRTEGILPALEPSHAIARSIDLARELSSDHVVLVNLSGRGDKDVEIVAAALGLPR